MSVALARSAGLAVLAAGILAAGTSPALALSSGLRAGVAEVDITPPVGHRMAGYYDERVATGTHDPLKARSIVLAQGQTKLALVYCDLLGVTWHVSTNARARRAFAEGSYEVTNSRVKPGEGERLAAAAIRLLRQLHPAPTDDRSLSARRPGA